MEPTVAAEEAAAVTVREEDTAPGLTNESGKYDCTRKVGSSGGTRRKISSTSSTGSAAMHVDHVVCLLALALDQSCRRDDRRRRRVFVITPPQ